MTSPATVVTRAPACLLGLDRGHPRSWVQQLGDGVSFGRVGVPRCRAGPGSAGARRHSIPRLPRAENCCPRTLAARLAPLRRPGEFAIAVPTGPEPRAAQNVTCVTALGRAASSRQPPRGYTRVRRGGVDAAPLARWSWAAMLPHALMTRGASLAYRGPKSLPRIGIGA